MPSGSNELRVLSQRLERAAAARIALDGVHMLADIYVARAKRVMGHDTNQLDRRTRVVSVTGTPSSAQAIVEADTPYAGHHNYGNPWTGPNLFWDRGLEAAEAKASDVGASLMSSVEAMLTSGGVWNPRRVV